MVTETETAPAQSIIDAIAGDPIRYFPTETVRAGAFPDLFLWGSSSSVTLTASLSGSDFSGGLLPSTWTIDPSVRYLQFDWWAQEWKRDTRFVSSLTKMVLHPAYQAIIGMGKEALPLIFRDLQRSRDHWLWALHAITQEDPAPEGADFATAVDAWIQWGQNHGYL